MQGIKSTEPDDARTRAWKHFLLTLTLTSVKLKTFQALRRRASPSRLSFRATIYFTKQNELKKKTVNAKQRTELQADYSRVARQGDHNVCSNILSGIALEKHRVNVFGRVSLIVNHSSNHASLDYDVDFQIDSFKKWMAGMVKWYKPCETRCYMEKNP